MSIPKAKRSTITDLVVAPDRWDFYPAVERSVLTSCKFNNLSSSTKIQRSVLNNVTVESASGSSNIERCKLTGCIVSDSGIERCDLKNCTLAEVNHIERTRASNTRLIGTGHIERTVLEDSDTLGKSAIERSTVKRSVIADSSRVTRSKLDGVTMNKSRVERASLKDCDVTNCNISRTNFSGMILKYGIWENGNLVGRTCNEEVVIKPKAAEMPPDQTSRPPEQEVGETNRTFHTEPTAESEDSSPIYTPRTLSPAKEHSPAAEEKMAATIPAGEYSSVTGLMDDGHEFPYDSYDGPEINPPPYEG